VTRFRALKYAGSALLVIVALDLVATAATLALGYRVLKP